MHSETKIWNQSWCSFSTVYWTQAKHKHEFKRLWIRYSILIDYLTFFDQTRRALAIKLGDRYLYQFYINDGILHYRALTIIISFFSAYWPTISEEKWSPISWPRVFFWAFEESTHLHKDIGGQVVLEAWEKSFQPAQSWGLILCSPIHHFMLTETRRRRSLKPKTLQNQRWALFLTATVLHSRNIGSEEKSSPSWYLEDRNKCVIIAEKYLVDTLSFWWTVFWLIAAKNQHSQRDLIHHSRGQFHHPLPSSFALGQWGLRVVNYISKGRFRFQGNPETGLMRSLPKHCL